MKLAEALILRADHKKRLEHLRERLLRIAKVQEGDDPAENPAALLAEAERVAQELTRLIQRINRTNSSARLDDKSGGQTIADAIAERDTLRLRHTLLSSVIQAAVVQQDRFTKSEVRFRSTVDVAALQQQADNLAQDYRELDTRIQSANWLIDLVD